MILHLTEPGSYLKVGLKTLIVMPEHRVFWPGSHRLQAIVLAAPRAVTTAAIAWCLREHVALLIEPDVFDDIHQIATWSCLLPQSGALRARRELAIRIAQYKVMSVKWRRLQAAKQVVLWKLGAMRSDPCWRDHVMRCRDHQLLFTIELKASEAYWRQFAVTPIRFTDTVPNTWTQFKARVEPHRAGRLNEKAPVFTARSARSPILALQNYALGAVATHLHRALCGLGMDPSIGCALHATRPGGLPLVWDCLEALRPRIYEAVFRFGDTVKFKVLDFPMQRNGSVRLGPEVKRELAKHVMSKAYGRKHRSTDGGTYHRRR